MDAVEVIKKLGLTKSPTEGGYYLETFKHPQKYPGDPNRSLVNDIYYLLTAGEVCAMHKVKVPTEIYSFYSGDPVEMIQVDERGVLKTFVLGDDLDRGQVSKVVVPRETWQGLRLVDGGRWVLLGITCVPGFEPGDYVGGRHSDFSQHAEVVARFFER